MTFLNFQFYFGLSENTYEMAGGSRSGALSVCPYLKVYSPPIIAIFKIPDPHHCCEILAINGPPP